MRGATTDTTAPPMMDAAKATAAVAPRVILGEVRSN